MGGGGGGCLLRKGAVEERDLLSPCSIITRLATAKGTNTS